jgi:hypothetical protein
VASLRAGNLDVTLYARGDSFRERKSDVPARARQVGGAAGLRALDPLPSQVRAGQTLPVVTYWAGPPPADLAVWLEPAGQPPITGRRRDPLPEIGPIRRIQFEVTIPAQATAAVVVLRAGGVEQLRWPLRVQPLPESTVAPAEQDLYPVDIAFGSAIRLRGWAVQSDHTGTITVTLEWACLEPVEKDVLLFVHLAGADERILTQADVVPGRPTQSWLPGERIGTRVTLKVPAGVTGSYRLHIGLYDPVAFERLPVADRADGRLTLTEITLR